MARQSALSPARWVAWWAWAALLPLVGGCEERPSAPPVDPAAAVERALSRRVSLDVVDEPLGEVVPRLLADAGVPLVNRATGRWPAEYPSLRVSLRLTDVRAESALRWLLWPRKLDYQLSAAGVEIVGCDDPESLVLQVHPVADILAIDPRFDAEALIEPVTSVIAPASWDEVGGIGTIEPTPGALIVVQRPRVQREIAALLNDIRANNARGAATEPRASASGGAASPLAHARGSEMSDAEAAMYAALRQPVSLDLDGPLPPLREWLRSVTDVNIVIDGEETAWTSLVGGRIHGLPLAEALDLVLSRDWDWRVRDEALYFERDEDDQFDLAQSVAFYPVVGLLDERNAYGGEGEFDAEDLIGAITSVVQPETWDEVGGAGSVCAVPGGLAVSQTRKLHAGVQEFLDRLRAARNPYREEIDFAPPHREQELLRALEQKVMIDWRDETLEVGLRELLFEQCGLTNVVFDECLEEDPLWGMRHATLFARDVRLSEALLHLEPQLATDRFDYLTLGFSTEKGILRMASVGSYALRCYRAQDPELWRVFFDLIQPYSWDEVGGSASVREFPGGYAVAQTAAVHAEIDGLLAALDRIDDPAAGRELRLDDSPEARRVRAALAAPVTLDMHGARLVDFAAALSDDYHLAVSLDRPGLDAAGIPLDEPLTGKYADISLGAALKHLLGSVGLGWSERPGGLAITSMERLAEMFETRVYPFPEPDGEEWELWELDNKIMEVTAAEWDDQDSTVATSRGVAGGFVVLQTADGHAEFGQILARLRTTLLGEPATPPPAAEVRIAAQLAQPAQLDRVAMPRVEALAQLAERHAAAIVVSPDVAERLRGRLGLLPEEATLADALDRVLRPLGLAWAVRDEAIVVDDRRSARMTETRVYDAGSLAALESALGEETDEGRPFEKLLAYVARDCGSERHSNVAAVGSLYLVRESAAGHERLATWLADATANADRLAALAVAVEGASDDDPAAAAAPFCEALLTGPPSVRALAAFLLCPRDPAVTSELIRNLPQDESSLPALLALAEAEEYAHVCEPAIVGLEVLGPRAAAAARQLAALIARTTDDRLDNLAFAALAEMGPAALPAVRGLLELDYQTTVRVLAVLEGWGPAAAPATSQLVEYLASGGDGLLGEHVCRTLAAIGPAGSDAVPLLVAHLRDGDPETTYAVAICRALGAMRAVPHLAVPALAGVLSDKQYRQRPFVRETACDALRQFGAEARPADAALRAAAEDSDPDVAAAARAALVAIAGENAP